MVEAVGKGLEVGERLQAAMRDQMAAGTWRPPSPADPKAAMAKAQARHLELLQDPERHAAWAQKLSEAHGGRVEVPCATCGAIVRVKPSEAKQERRRFCGQDCFRGFLSAHTRERAAELAAQSNRPVEHMCPVCGTAFTGPPRRRYCARRCKDATRRHRHEGVCATCGAMFQGARGQRYCSTACAAASARAQKRRPAAEVFRDPAVRAHMCEGARARSNPRYSDLITQLRALPHEAFDRLPEDFQRMVRLYYGLESLPCSKVEIAQQLGRSRSQVERGLVVAVALLVGTDMSADPFQEE